MLKKAISIYLSVFLLAIVITGCMNCDSQVFQFKWKDMSLSSSSYWMDGNNIATSQYDTGTDFSKKGYALRVVLNGEVAANTPSFAGFTNTAYAKCELDRYETDVKITGLHVFTVHPYDSSHSINAEITDYFKTPSTQPGVGGLQPFNLGAPQSSFEAVPKSYFELFMDTRPAITGRHQFKVLVTFSDGGNYSGLTPELTF